MAAICVAGIGSRVGGAPGGLVFQRSQDPGHSKTASAPVGGHLAWPVGRCAGRANDQVGQSLARIGLRLCGVLPDPDDDKFLACALEAQVDCIVTCDADVLSVGRYRGIDVLRPREFLERLTCR